MGFPLIPNTARDFTVYCAAVGTAWGISGVVGDVTCGAGASSLGTGISSLKISSIGLDGCTGACAAILFGISERPFWEEITARLKHVTRKRLAKIVVVFTNIELVLASNKDSAEAKFSVNPPPRPDCIKMIKIRNAHTSA